jgi:nucleotide-binding universal stress UspA family protein
MKTIIVPTDFSEISLNAVKYAADMACVLNSDLAILHVVGIPKNFIESSPPIYSVTELVEQAEKQLKLLKIQMLVRTHNKIDVFIKTIIGEFVSVLDDYCAMFKTYAIVMGAESAGFVERIFFGGKTISAVKKLPYPLIVVPNKAEFTGLKKIGLACDFKDVIETIPVYDIASLLKACSAELYVLHVSQDGDSFSEETDEEAGLFQTILGEFNPKYRFIQGADVEKGITEFADKNKLDLLIVIPKKHNLVGQLFHRSRSKQLVLQSHVPVMAIHEQE